MIATKNAKLLVGLALLVMLMSGVTQAKADASLDSKHDSPPVTDLKEMLANHYNARTWLRTALKEAKDLPDGRVNPWRNKSLDDVFTFINEWYYFLPQKHNGLDKIMEFSLLYYQNEAGLKFVNQEPGLSWANRFVEHRGQYLDSKESLAGVRLWMEDSSINNQEFIEPEGGYLSFNDYFIRNLKPGRRPIADAQDADVLVSPADCIISRIANDLKADTAIPTKGRMSLNLLALLDGSKYADKFVGGDAYSCFLMPDNYHHYHSPVAGIVVESNADVGYKLFGMPDLVDMVNNGDPGHNKDFSVFEYFKHGYLIIDTEAVGHIAMVPIGLQTVGSVVFEDKFKDISDDSQVLIGKGDKVGHFAYGGSTVLLLFQPGRFNALSVKQGQRIGHAN